MSGKQKTNANAGMDEVSRVLEARGLYCPEPVMMMHALVAELSSGEVFKVIATDPSTQRDIPKFCQFLGHELIEEQEVEGEYLYWIRVA